MPHIISRASLRVDTATTVHGLNQKNSIAASVMHELELTKKMHTEMLGKIKEKKERKQKAIIIIHDYLLFIIQEIENTNRQASFLLKFPCVTPQSRKQMTALSPVPLSPVPLSPVLLSQLKLPTHSPHKSLSQLSTPFALKPPSKRPVPIPPLAVPVTLKHSSSRPLPPKFPPATTLKPLSMPRSTSSVLKPLSLPNTPKLTTTPTPPPISIEPVEKPVIDVPKVQWTSLNGGTKKDSNQSILPSTNDPQLEQSVQTSADVTVIDLPSMEEQSSDETTCNTCSDGDSSTDNATSNTDEPCMTSADVVTVSSKTDTFTNPWLDSDITTESNDTPFDLFPSSVSLHIAQYLLVFCTIGG